MRDWKLGFGIWDLHVEAWPAMSDKIKHRGRVHNPVYLIKGKGRSRYMEFDIGLGQATILEGFSFDR